MLTSREVEDLLIDGREDMLREVEVVTTGTMGIMSGTYALLSFQICKPGAHRRFVKVRLNSVPQGVPSGLMCSHLRTSDNNWTSPFS